MPRVAAEGGDGLYGSAPVFFLALDVDLFIKGIDSFAFSVEGLRPFDVV
jgi:hypothetical protein